MTSQLLVLVFAGEFENNLASLLHSKIIIYVRIIRDHGTRAPDALEQVSWTLISVARGTIDRSINR